MVVLRSIIGELCNMEEGEVEYHVEEEEEEEEEERE